MTLSDECKKEIRKFIRSEEEVMLRAATATEILPYGLTDKAVLGGMLFVITCSVSVVSVLFAYLGVC